MDWPIPARICNFFKGIYMNEKAQKMLEVQALVDAIRCGTANDELSMAVNTINVLAGMVVERMEGLLEG